MNNDLRPINTIPNFKRFCMTIGELPTSYLETMTYYEMLVWFTEYIKNTIIPTINNNGLAVQELQDKYIELKSYVDNYFTNLDVQEEINNKLDQMVTDGTLPEIIASYLNSKAIWGFDTVADMKNATNLINGSFAKTLGYYSKNDGGNALYKIRTKTNDDIINEYDIISLHDNNLIAEYIENNIVNIKQIGYINTMTETEQTTFLNYIFNKYKNILIKNENITINDSLNIKSNQNIKMESSTIHNISTTNQTFIFKLNNVENVNINGLDSSCYFDKPNLPQQACLRIVNSKNIYFNGIDLLNVGGDGVTISGSNNETISDNIIIENLLINNSNRNGISLIGGVKNCYFKNLTISNTSGVNPQFAIDLETWQDDIYNENITIDSCIIKNNVGGIDIMPYNKNITIKNCKLYNAINSVITMAKGENAYPKNIIIDNNNFENCGIYLRGTQYAEYKIINNNFIKGQITTDTESDFIPYYATNPKKGYIHILNNSIKESSSNCIMIGGSSNVIISNNILQDPINRCISVLSSNNVKICNNTLKNYAQNENNKESINCFSIATTHNILIDGNIFINEQDVTFSRIISLAASCQKLIIVNNNALNINYTTFLGKDGTVTNEVNANNLINS